MKYLIPALAVFAVGCETLPEAPPQNDAVAQAIIAKLKESSKSNAPVSYPDNIYTSVTLIWNSGNDNLGDTLYYLENKSFPYDFTVGSIIRDEHGNTGFIGTVSKVEHTINLSPGGPPASLWHNLKVTMIDSSIIE